MILVFLLQTSYVFANVSIIDAEIVLPDVPLQTGSTIQTIYVSPIQFEETEDYIRLDDSFVTVDFYKGSIGYNQIFNVSGDVVVGDERYVLEYAKNKEDQWKPCGEPYGVTWLKVNDFYYNVTRHYTDYAGTNWNITFVVRSGLPIKSVVTVDFGQTDNYRISWHLDGIPYTKNKTGKNNVFFGNEDLGFDWADVYEVFGNISTPLIESRANGKKLTVNFDIGLNLANSSLVLDPSVIASTTESTAFGNMYQRTIFWDGTNWWLFFHNGTGRFYTYSTNPTTWTNTITKLNLFSIYPRGGFDVAFNGTNGVSVIYGGQFNYRIYHQFGEIAGNAITWVANATRYAEGTYYQGLDGDYYSASYYRFLYHKATANDVIAQKYTGVWAFETVDADETINSGIGGVIQLGLDSAVLLNILMDGNAALKWSTGTNDFTSLGETAAGGEASFSAVGQGSAAHLVWLDNSNNVKYKRYNGTGWDPTETISTGEAANSFPVISYDETNDKLYVIWGDSTADYIYYNRRSGSGTVGTWDASNTILVDESTNELRTSVTYGTIVSVPEYCNNSVLPVLYLTGTASPWNMSVVVINVDDPFVVSGAITDMDDTDNVYEMKKYYTFQGVVNDPGGADTIENVSLRIINGTTVMGEVKGDDLSTVPVYSIVSNATEIDIDSASCSWGKSGDVGTITFKIRFEWDFEDKTNLDLNISVTDVDGNTAAWTEVQSGYFDVIGRLVIDGFTADNTNVLVSSNITFTGLVRYATTIDGNASSSSFPPDAQFTAVVIHNSTHDSQGNDTSIVNGAFSVEFTVPSTIGTYVYHVYLDLVPDYVDGDAPDGQTISVDVIDAILLMSFDDEIGSMAIDSGGNGNDGAINGATRTGFGYFGRALVFDGVDDYINVSSSVTLNVTSDIVISMWINTSNPGVQGLFVREGSYGLSLISNYGLRFTVNSTDVDSLPNVFTPNTWTYVTGTYDGHDVNIYVNGSNVVTSSLTGVIAQNDNDVFIGNSTTNFFEGSIDEIRMYDFAVKNWWNLSWSYKTKLTFNNSASAVDLNNFPVLIQLNDTNTDWTQFMADGEDIRFIDADNITELDYEIERWNDTYYAWIWVEVPTIDAGSVTDHIWMYHGYSSAVDGQDITGTWDVNYVLVQHMNNWTQTSNDNRTTVATGQVEDSTANANDGDLFYLNTTGLVGWWAFEDGNASTTVTDLSGEGNTGTWSGKAVGDKNVTDSYDGLGDAGYFDGTNDYVSVGTTASFSFIQNTAVFSIELWLKLSDYTDASTMTILANTPTTTEKGFLLQWRGATDDLRISIYRGVGAKFVVLSESSNNIISDNDWHHVMITCDGINIRFYVDAVGEVGSSSVNILSVGDSSRIANIGRYPFGAPGEYINASMDDIRIYNRTLFSGEVESHYRQWIQNQQINGALVGDEHGLYVEVTNSASLNITSDLTLEGLVYGDVLNFATESDADFDGFRMNGYTLINSGEEVYLWNSGYTSYGTTLTPTVTVTAASDYYEYEFYLDNDREESNATLMDGDSDSNSKVLYDDDTLVWDASNNVVISTNTSIEVKGINCSKLAVSGGDGRIADTTPNDEDWSGYDFISFYWYGVNTGNNLQVRVMDGLNYFYTYFKDDFSGWRRIVLPMNDFTISGAASWTSVDTIYFTDLPDGNTFYLDRVVLDVGQWVKVETFIPDTLDTTVQNVEIYSYDGASFDTAFAQWDAENDNPAESKDLSKLHALDTTPYDDIYSANGGITLYLAGERTATVNRVDAGGAGATMDYSSNYGTTKRVGFAIKLPPDDGQDNSTDGISQTKLKVRVYYSNSGATSPEMPPLIYKDDSYSLDIYNGTIRMGVYDGSAWNYSSADGTELVDDTWTYIAGVYTNTTGLGVMSTYHNGSLDTTTLGRANISLSAENLRLGTNATEDFLWLRYDEIRISNDSRSGDWVEAQSSVMFYTFYTNGSTILKTATSLNPSIGSMKKDPIQDFPYSLQTEITDMDCTDWVFVGDSYTFVATFVRQNASYPITSVDYQFNDGVNWHIMTFDVTTGLWSLSSSGLYEVINDNSTSGNEYVSINIIYFTTSVYDALDVDIYMYCLDNASRSDALAITDLDYFNIYNLGGMTAFADSGDGGANNTGSVLGEGTFGLSAQNSSFVNGSWAYANITWRKLQHTNFLFHWWQGTGWDVAGEYWDCPTEHNNTGYVDYGVNYWHNGSWIEGWKVRLTVADGDAGTHGIGTNQAWIKVNASWYNRGVYVTSDEFYAYYEAINSTDTSTQFALYVDLWVSDEGGSSQIAGRVGAEYFGMSETGWGPWANWRPVEGLVDESIFADNLKDASGYTISAQELELFIFWANISKTSNSTIAPGCDNHQFALIEYDGPHYRTQPVTEVMQGISSPMWPKTVTPGEVPAEGFFGSMITAMIEGITKPLLAALTGGATTLYFVMASIIDSAFTAFGISGFVTAITTMITAYGGYIPDSMVAMTLIVTQMFRIVTSASLTMINWVTQMLNFIFILGGYVVRILDGTQTGIGALQDMWALMNFNEWATGVFIPLMLFVFWMQSLDERARKMGGGWVSSFIGDLQMMSFVLSFFIDWMTRVIEFVIARVSWLINAIKI